MFSLFGQSGRLCDAFSRRELLTLGGLSLFGLNLPEFLCRRAAAKEARSRNSSGFGQADSVILVYLQGSPSHIDLWDPKPQAPAEIRGEFRPIATTTLGLFVGEVLPMLAQQARHYALVRSIGVDPKGLRNHGAAIYMLMTGHDPGNFSPTGLAVPSSREDLPSVGAVVARYRAAEMGNFGNVAVGAPVKEGRVIGVGQSAGLLGGAYDPYTMYDDATKPLRLEGFVLPDDITLDRLGSRVDLKAVIELQASADSETAHTRAFDAYYETALSLIQSTRAVRAFHVHVNPPVGIHPLQLRERALQRDRSVDVEFRRKRVMRR